MKINPLARWTTGSGWLLAAFLSVFHISAADLAGQWQVKPVAVMVVAPEGGKDNRNYCWKPGVTVSALLIPPAGKIISINQDESKIISFTDDKGTNLMVTPATDDPFSKPGLSCMLPQSEGGQPSVIMDLKAAGLPAQGATALNISGQVVVQTGGDSSQTTVDNLAIKTGSIFTAAPLLLKIGDTHMQTNSYDHTETFSVTFNCAQSLDSISSIEFFDPQGNKIEANKSSWGGGDFVGYMVEYALKKKVEHARVTVNCWKDLKTVTVPFTLKTSVGL